MTAFIDPSQKLIVLDTNNIQVGGSPDPIITTLNLDESVVGTTPVTTVSFIDSVTPFSIGITNNNTSTPGLEVTFDSPITDLVLGKKYGITITSNGQTDTLEIVCLYSENYNPQAWSNADTEDNVGGFYTINQIPQGKKLLSSFVNSKLRSLLEYATLLNFKVLNLYSTYKLKKNLPDIINAAIFSGSIPAGYTGVITYVTGTTQIDTIILQDTNSDSDSYTKITFNYVSKTKTITVGGIGTSSSFNALDSINVDRVTDITGVTKKYTISKVQITRTDTTFTSVVDSDYTVTMPLVTGWTVTE